YLGGIFYGTFLFFTVHGLVLIFLALQSYSQTATRAVAVVLLALSLYGFQPNPLLIQIAAQEAADRRALNDQIVTALAQKVTKTRSFADVVFLPAPHPVTGEYLRL